MLKINLKKLIKDYDQNLLDNLRGFGKDDEFLKFWVPGTGYFQSFLNLLDALIETKIFNFILIIEINNDDKQLYSNIENVLFKISDFDKNLEGKILSINIKINKIKYDAYLKNKKNKNSNIKEKEIDKTKKVEVLKISESINPLYKKNMESLNPKDYSSNINFKDMNLYTQEIEDGVIALEIKDKIIINLFQNVKKNNDLNKLLNNFFEIIENKNIQEAADHGTIYLEEKIRRINNKIINDGIILPTQAGYYFYLINKAIRNIFYEYKIENKIELDINKDYYEMSSEWKKLNNNEKLSKINFFLKELSNKHKELTENSLSVNKIENNFKIYLNVDKNFSNLQQKTNILLDIEIKLKKLDDTLEVFIDEILDQNKLRLKNSPQNI